ncbi:hypothetical protein M8J77_010606 [Diaphorina citri]|nr:hypothetical protein M8J77_010606 [Diaphorina citri]
MIQKPNKPPTTRRSFKKEYAEYSLDRIVPDHQFPFRFGYSTVQQIHCVVNIISSTLEEKSHCSAAFDRVWQTGLLYKLKQLLPQHHYLLLKAYLSDRLPILPSKVR